MAINTQKLLPSAKGGALVKFNAGGASSSLTIKRKSIDANKLALLSQKRNEQNVSIIQKSLIDVDSLLKSVLTEDQQTERTKRQIRDQEEAEKRETKLETPKETKKFKLPGVSLPGMGFLDRIKRFLFFTALGWLFNTFQKELPKLEGIVKVIMPIYGVVENIFKFILESTVNFIDRAYETYDKLRGLVKTVGGENAQAEFDKISGKLNEYINYVLIGGMALTGAINTFAQNARNYKPPKPPAPKPPVPRGPRGPLERTITRPAQAAAIRASRNIIGKQATKQILRTIKGPLSRVPLVGGLIEFGLSWALGDSPGKAAFRGVGSTLLGGVGMAIGAFPPLLPFGGPLIGSFLGGWAGAELGGLLYDVLFTNKKPAIPTQKQRGGGKVIKRYATGGQVVGERGRTLTIRSTKKVFLPEQKSQPGKDVGGKNKIKQLYPDPSTKLSEADWELAGYPLVPKPKDNEKPKYQDYLKEWESRKKEPNGFRALTGVSDVLKDIPYGLGALMGGAVDIALGQNLAPNTIKSSVNALVSLFSPIISSAKEMSQEVYGARNGMQIGRTGGISKTDELNESLKKMLFDGIQKKINTALLEVKKQLSLKKEEKYTAEEYAKTGGGGRYTPPSQQERFPEGPTGKNGRYKPEELMKVGPLAIPADYKDWYGNNAYLRKSDAGPAFIKAKQAAAKEKVSFVINSAYRSYEHQDFMVKSGKYAVIAPAGKSSHGDGTAVDIEVGTPGWQWLKKNGLDYGWKWMQYEEDEVHFAYVGGGKFEKTQQIPKQKPTTTPTKPPQSPSSPNTKTAEASWYGPGFYGNRTADGTKLQRNSMWVAHKTLPFGTKVKFTYRGKTVTLLVKDRGPFYGNREWDFTEAAAEAIGLKTGPNSGTGVVEYQILELGKSASITQEQVDKIAGLKPFDMESILPMGGFFSEPLNPSKVFSLPSKDTNIPFLSDAELSPESENYIPKQSNVKDTSSLKTYPTYSYEGTIAIQPIIYTITKTVPVPTSGNKSTTFTVSGGVNNSNMQSLSRG